MRQRDCSLELLTPPSTRRYFALSYFYTAYGFTPRLERKPLVCWVVLAALNEIGISAIDISHAPLVLRATRLQDQAPLLNLLRKV